MVDKKSLSELSFIGRMSVALPCWPSYSAPCPRRTNCMQTCLSGPSCQWAALLFIILSSSVGLFSTIVARARARRPFSIKKHIGEQSISIGINLDQFVMAHHSLGSRLISQMWLVLESFLYNRILTATFTNGTYDLYS